MKANGRKLQFTPIYHRIEETDGGVGRDVFYVYFPFREDSFV